VKHAKLKHARKFKLRRNCHWQCHVAGEKNGANSSFVEIWRKNRFSSNVLLQLMEETSGGK
jgi:hypothetical protein